VILTAATIFLILAIAFMLLGAFRVAASIGWVELAWASFFLAVLFGLR